MTSENKELIAKVTIKDGNIENLTSVGDHINRVFIFQSNGQFHSIKSSQPINTKLLDSSVLDDGTYTLVDKNEVAIGKFDIVDKKVTKLITTDDDLLLIGTTLSGFQVFGRRPSTILDINMFSELEDGSYNINET